MKSKGALIVLLGGGLVCDRGVWRPTTFREKRNDQRLGDVYRIHAVAALYKRLLNANLPISIFVSGGKGVSKDPNHPIIADILQEQLLLLGVPSRSIFLDRRSENTFKQIISVQEFISKREFDLVYVVSNKYHIPRIRAMSMYSPKLMPLAKKLSRKQIKLVSAESVLLRLDAGRWRKELKAAYQSQFMAERMRMERRGIRAIKDRTYHW